MIISMKIGATEQQIERVLKIVQAFRFESRLEQGKERAVICVIGVGSPERLARLVSQVEVADGVDFVTAITKRYKRASRESHNADTVFPINGNITVGDGRFVVVAGPCSVESAAMMRRIAHSVKKAGACMLRGGAFKPRTSPDEFEGLGEEGLRILSTVYQETGLPVVTEVMESTEINLVAQYAHVLQIGSRNMQNFRLLDAVGESEMPALLKRGWGCTFEEWMLAAERLLKLGNNNVMLCERGIRTQTEVTRFTLDVGAIIAAKRLTHLPIIADPSHAAGDRKLVAAHAYAAAAAGCDGLIVEVHHEPDRARSDGKQSLTIPQFEEMMKILQSLLSALGRQLHTVTVAV